MADDVPTTTAPARRRPSRRALTLVGVPLAITGALGYLGDALAPSLVDTHPAWLIALNARNRNLVLVTNDMDAWSYYAIGVVRLMISDPLFFLLGYWYGDAAVAWMERRTKTWGQLLRQAEGWFGKAAHPLVFVAPNNVICLFAGAAGMSLRVFFALNLSGTVVRLWLIRRFGEAFEGPLDGVVGWIGDNRTILLPISILLVVASVALEAKRGEVEVTALAHLDDELAGADTDGDGADGADGAAPVREPDAARGPQPEAAGEAGPPPAE